MSLRLAGYAALFRVTDGVGDRLEPGAFAQSLRRLAQGEGTLPLLWQHRPQQRIGTVEWLQEDERGLQIIARIDRPQSRAAEQLRAGLVSGLSFGYRATGTSPLPRGRLLSRVDVLEISLVTHPVQHASRVHLLH